MSTPVSAEKLALVAARVRENPSGMTLQLARSLEVPEVEVVRALPDGRSVELDVDRWEELLTAFADLGRVHVIVSNGSVTCETVGEFGGFSTVGEFFNVQSPTLDMHIRWEQLGSAFAVAKPSHMEPDAAVPADLLSGPPLHERRITLSIQFFDKKGDSALKVFFSFGGKPTAQQAERWLALRDRFRRQA